MPRAGALLAFLLILMTQVANMASAQEVELALPHPLRPGEMAWLAVEVGPVGGRQIEVTTSAGQKLGTISPFGIRAGQPAGTYTLPIPASAIEDGRLVARFSITQPGGPPRPATAAEVRSVKLNVTGPR
jgi:hypothetical protein